MKYLSYILLFLISTGLSAQNEHPTLEIKSWESVGANVIIKYTLSDAENDPSKIELRAYQKLQGGFVPVNTSNATGDLGNNILPGEREISWPKPVNAGIYSVDIIADDGQIVNIQDLVDQVDTTKLKSNLQWLEGIRHKTAGATHLQETRDSILNFFVKSGLDTIQHHFKFGNYQALNVIGNKHGARNKQHTYIADAHYDSVASGPGADDNASGVAGFMEIARILSEYTFENNLRFIGFDLEEDGLIGSTAYVKNAISPYDTIKADINFEMIGYYSNKNNTQTSPPLFDLVFPAAYAKLVADTFKGNFITDVADYNSKPLSDAFLMAASQYVPDLKVIDLSVPDKGKTIPDLRRSDHANFWDKNIQSLMLTDGADFRNKAYHTANDKSSILNMNFMGNTVKASLATLAKLAKPISGDVAGFTMETLVATKEAFIGNLKVNPNPAKHILNITAPELFNGISLNVYDLNGRMVYYKKLNSNDLQMQLDVSGWPSSNYAIILKTTKGNYTGKVIKE